MSVDWLTMKWDSEVSGEPEESIIRTARGLYVGDLINEKE